MRSPDVFVGEFHELPRCHAETPSIRWTVRARAADEDAGLVNYLNSGTVLRDRLGTVPDVLGAEGTHVGELQVLTDGRWVWRSDLAYYVRWYHVLLEPRFRAHVGAHGSTCSEPAPSDLDRLSRLVGDYV
jgi:hypothetical protein